jgi:hypothetical protein
MASGKGFEALSPAAAGHPALNFVTVTKMAEVPVT